MTAAEQRVIREVLDHLAQRYTETCTTSHRHAIVLVADKLVDGDGPRLVVDAAGAHVVAPEVDRG